MLKMWGRGKWGQPSHLEPVPSFALNTRKRRRVTDWHEVSRLLCIDCSIEAAGTEHCIGALYFQPLATQLHRPRTSRDEVLLGEGGRSASVTTGYPPAELGAGSDGGSLAEYVRH
jgi:hypothetical protein